MARMRSLRIINKEAKKMRSKDAFTGNQLYALREAVTTCVSRIDNILLNELDFTIDDFYRLTCDPETADILRKASDLSSSNSRYASNSHITVGTNRFHFWVSDKYLVPKTELINKDTYAVDIAVRLARYKEQRCEWGVNFGRVKWVVERLNRLCTNPQQVRYLFPSILNLMSMRPDLQQLHNELLGFTRPRIIPPVPRTLRDQMQLASTTIAAFALLPSVVTDAPREIGVGIEGLSHSVRIDEHDYFTAE